MLQRLNDTIRFDLGFLEIVLLDLLEGLGIVYRNNLRMIGNRSRRFRVIALEIKKSRIEIVKISLFTN